MPREPAYARDIGSPAKRAARFGSCRPETNSARDPYPIKSDSAEIALAYVWIVVTPPQRADRPSYAAEYLATRTR